MICRILLLIILASCVSGMFEPQDSALNYQAEENSSITAEWRFSSKANVSIPSLKIHCVFVTPELRVFYHLDHSIEEPQHEQFAGRVRCDKHALRTGRVRLRLSGVRTEDSGRYLCRMVTQSGKKVKEFSLHVAAKPTQVAVEMSKPAKPEAKPASRGRPGLYAGLGLAVAAAGLAACRWTSHCLKGKRRTQERCAVPPI
ncbi:programmed cell death 1 ligand 1-like [Chelmon rostratus]|uniref:programmed cell death 1 ligand 1-like n=1 Tax=Chelmon rostratus TaxID=109905 RepID=UPI001BE6F73F|nr:programmed cell death 1 ligand 1-like [Chelmon rostratus]